MRFAVSGVTGFVGAHLTRELVEHGHEVVGLGLGPEPPALAGFLGSYVDQDLRSAWPSAAADGVHCIVHLAGLSAVGPSFDDPQGYLEGNSAPVTRLGECLLDMAVPPRVLVVSTGALYAPGVGLDESAPTQASSPYAVSKLLVEAQSEYYRRRGLDVVVMRPFNHIGPGQQPGFVLPDLIAGMTSGKLVVGNLDTRRDYTDVRDVARAYRLVAEADSIHPHVLNVCSASSTSGRELLDLAVEELGLNMPKVEVDPSRIRPNDPPEIRGDNARIAEAVGWHPVIDLRTTVRDTIAHATQT